MRPAYVSVPESLDALEGENPRMLLGLAGKAQTGKSTAAELLKHRMGFEAIAFADAIKGFCRAAQQHWTEGYFEGPLKEEVDPIAGQSPREAFQRIGDYGRRLDPRMWINLVEKQLRAYPSDRIVISDVRTREEAAFVREKGGLVVHVRRRKVPAVHPHITESGVEYIPGDAILLNDSKLEDLRIRLADIVESLAHEIT